MDSRHADFRCAQRSGREHGAPASQDIRTAANVAARLRSLVALQQQIERYEYRTQNHAPWLTRFG
ncbi:hypothetical protein AWV80_19875 [Cupriavidus sp. UYMU48A]|nr:hypothetical protein AWV80_19875 [Cupriavidus sp. UYMU48A]